MNEFCRHTSEESWDPVVACRKLRYRRRQDAQLNFAARIFLPHKASVSANATQPGNRAGTRGMLLRKPGQMDSPTSAAKSNTVVSRKKEISVYNGDFGANNLVFTVAGQTVVEISTIED
jgi:hypothetical protein